MNKQYTFTAHVVSAIYVWYIMDRNKTISVENTQLITKNLQLMETRTKLTSECETLRGITDVYVREARERERYGSQNLRFG